MSRSSLESYTALRYNTIILWLLLTDTTSHVSNVLNSHFAQCLFIFQLFIRWKNCYRSSVLLIHWTYKC